MDVLQVKRILLGKYGLCCRERHRIQALCGFASRMANDIHGLIALMYGNGLRSPHGLSDMQRKRERKELAMTGRR